MGTSPSSLTPEFTPAGYEHMLTQLASLGYALLPVDDIPAWTIGRAAYLRHDIDATIQGAPIIASIEERCLARSSWHVRPDAHYNPWHEPNRQILQRLKDAGHTLGLHWTAAAAPAAALPFTPTSHSRHRPGTPPTLPPGVAYISDSGRAWRTTSPSITTLLAGNGPDRVLLLTHHEHWIGHAPALDEHYATTITTLAATTVLDAIHDEYHAALNHPARQHAA